MSETGIRAANAVAKAQHEQSSQMQEVLDRTTRMRLRGVLGRFPCSVSMTEELDAFMANEEATLGGAFVELLNQVSDIIKDRFALQNAELVDYAELKCDVNAVRRVLGSQ